MEYITSAASNAATAATNAASNAASAATNAATNAASNVASTIGVMTGLAPSLTPTTTNVVIPPSYDPLNQTRIIFSRVTSEKIEQLRQLVISISNTPNLMKVATWVLTTIQNQTILDKLNKVIDELNNDTPPPYSSTEGGEEYNQDYENFKEILLEALRNFKAMDLIKCDKSLTSSKKILNKNLGRKRIPAFYIDTFSLPDGIVAYALTIDFKPITGKVIKISISLDEQSTNRYVAKLIISKDSITNLIESFDINLRGQKLPQNNVEIYIVAHKLSGEDLKQWMNRNKIPPNEIQLYNCIWDILLSPQIDSLKKNEISIGYAVEIKRRGGFKTKRSKRKLTRRHKRTKSKRKLTKKKLKTNRKAMKRKTMKRKTMKRKTMKRKYH